MRFIFTYCEIRILAEITALLRFRYELLNKFLVLNHLIKVLRIAKNKMINTFEPGLFALSGL